MDIARLMKRACPHIGDEEAMAYASPYPDASYKAGVRAFPNLVPDRADAPGAAISRQAREFWRNAWTGKSLMAIGMKDPVLGPPTMRRCTRPSATVHSPSRSPRAVIFCRNGVRGLHVSGAMHSRRRRSSRPTLLFRA